MKLGKRISIFSKKALSVIMPVKSIDALIYEQQKRERSLKIIVDKITELEAQKQVVESDIRVIERKIKEVKNSARIYAERNNDEMVRQGYDLLKDMDLKLSSFKTQKETLENVLAPLKNRRNIVEQSVREKRIEIEALKIKNTCTEITNNAISILEEVDADLLSTEDAERSVNVDSVKSELRFKELQDKVTTNTYLIQEEVGFEEWKKSLLEQGE